MKALKIFGFSAIAGVALLAVARGAKAAGLAGGAGAGSIPVPSDSSLIQKYGIFNPSHNILLLAQQSLASMRIQYAAQTTSCKATLEGEQVNPIGMAGTAINMAAQAAQFIPVVGGPISQVISAIGSVFDHHREAAAREQATLCAATYAANKTLDQFDAWIADGQLAASQAQAALETIYQRLVQSDAPVAQGCPPSSATGGAANRGNEACIVNRVFQAIAEKRLAQLGIVGNVQ